MGRGATEGDCDEESSKGVLGPLNVNVAGVLRGLTRFGLPPADKRIGGGIPIATRVSANAAYQIRPRYR